MTRIRYFIRWFAWYIQGPIVDHLNPGDTREGYVAAHAAWVRREPKEAR